MSQGTQIQLNAFGASDIYISNRNLEAEICANNRDSIMYWFIEHEDGFATQTDINYLTDKEQKEVKWRPYMSGFTETYKSYIEKLNQEIDIQRSNCVTVNAWIKTPEDMKKLEEEEYSDVYLNL